MCCLRRQLETLDTVVKFLLDERPRSFHDCVAWARNLFQANFSTQAPPRRPASRAPASKARDIDEMLKGID